MALELCLLGKEGQSTYGAKISYPPLPLEQEHLKYLNLNRFGQLQMAWAMFRPF